MGNLVNIEVGKFGNFSVGKFVFPRIRVPYATKVS